MVTEPAEQAIICVGSVTLKFGVIFFPVTNLQW